MRMHIVIIAQSILYTHSKGMAVYTQMQGASLLSLLAIHL